MEILKFFIFDFFLSFSTIPGALQGAPAIHPLSPAHSKMQDAPAIHHLSLAHLWSIRQG
jgi:hypothetical protein